MKHEQFQDKKDGFFFDCGNEFAKEMQAQEAEILENAKQIDDKEEAIKYVLHKLTFLASSQSFEAAVSYCDHVVDALFEAIFENDHSKE